MAGPIIHEADQASEAPNRVPWPPILFGAAILAGLALGTLAPAPAWLDGPILRGLGWALVAAGITLDLTAAITMWRSRANILPHRPATALVTSGPFAWSRNPIYLGNTTALCGAGLAFANPWLIVAGLTAAAAVHRLAIVREEAHLARLFGADWDAYRRRTPRWLGW